MESPVLHIQAGKADHEETEKRDRKIRITHYRVDWGTSLRLYLLVTTRRVDNEVMRMQKTLPIGNDQFRIVREKDYYYIDKTLLIKEFLELRDTASLITRPRRFGKTLNMTMLREFFDITRDSREIFKGLAIMDTKYASLINTKPVIYFSFKDCSGKTQDELKVRLSKEILKEYQRYAVIFESGSQDKRDVYVRIFYNNLEKLISCSMSFAELSAYVEELIRVVHDHYGAAPILLIDEYDQPVLSSYENGYRKELGDFFCQLLRVCPEGK